jgi:hypothetical protein
VVIDAETGFMAIPAEEKGAEAGSSLPVGLRSLAERQREAAERILKLVKGACEGTLPLERELHKWEPAALNATHVSMCIDRALGFTVKEVAERHEYTPRQTGVVLAHPYSQLLISTMLSAAADKVQDVSSRLEALAPEALNTKVDLLRSTKSENLRDKIASDLLDRAGYGSRKKLDVNLGTGFAVPASLAATLGSVMDESKQVASLDYSRYISSSSESNSTGRDSALQPSAGHTLPVAVPPAAEVRQESAEEASLREEKEWAEDTKRLRIA